MEFLLEINTEEMPCLHVEAGLSQLEEKIREELHSSDIPIYQIKTYGTCRRLAVAGDFSPAQKDREEKVIGPPKAVSYTPGGTFSSAAEGFAKSQGVSIDELKVISTEKGEYIGLKKILKGKPTEEVLAQILPDIISSLSFPKMMRWGENPLRFSRPIKNILCLFDQKYLSFSICGISSNSFTTGHKIYSPRKIRAKTFVEYKKALKKNKVVVDPETRKKMILHQIEKKLAPLKAQVLIDEQLLTKLTYDVEHPYVFLGTFPEEYLKLPLEILSTAMKEGQNLFSVLKGKNQMPHFIGVADAYKDSRAFIRKGNEGVLKARLEDARFFWNQDRKQSMKDKSKSLNKIIFQENLGSYEDKALRLAKIVSYLADKLDSKKEKKYFIEAAELCKSDLMTEMVKEFPLLQGIVGGLYAREEEFPVSVWKAIYEHYQPLSMQDTIPSQLSGTVLSIADKLDSIVGVVGVGREATGSKDPFGLRRNALGLCRIVLEKKLSFSFLRLLDKVVLTYEDKLAKSKNDIKDYCLQFFAGRLQYIFESKGYRYDLINAALASGIDNIYYCYLKLKALDSLKDSPKFEPMILIAKRVNNILRGQPQYKLNEELLYEKEERELYTTFSIIRDNVLPLISKGDFSKAQKIIFRMRPSINNFFDNVLVMIEDKRLRRNRLALLQEISKLLIQIADYSQIVSANARP